MFALSYTGLMMFALSYTGLMIRWIEFKASINYSGIFINTRNSRRFAPFFLALEGASRPSSKLVVNMFSLCTSKTKQK